MVEAQTKNQNIFWLWSNKVAWAERGDVSYWLPQYEEVAEILNKTNSRPLADLSEIITKGETPRTKGDVYVESGVPFIRVTNISEDGIKTDDLVKISQYTHNRLKRSIIKPNDIVFSMAGTIGVATVIPDEINEANINQAVTKIRLKKEINPVYVSTFLNSKYGRLQSLRFAGGGVQKNIDFHEIKRIRIFLPTPQEQRMVEQIVKEALRLKDEAEEERREADLILENSIKEFFITDDQKPFWKWSNDIEIVKTLEPNFWKKTVSSKKHPSIKLGDIFNFQKGTEVGSALYQDNGIPFLRVSDLGDLEISFGNSSKYINETLFNELRDEFQPHEEELLFSKDATIGLVAKVWAEEKQIISSGILRLQRKSKDFDADFLLALLTNKFVNQEFVKNSTGSVIKHLNTSKLSETELPLVNKQIQDEVADRVKSFWIKRNLSKQKLQEAQDFVENLIKNQINKVKK